MKYDVVENKIGSFWVTCDRKTTGLTLPAQCKTIEMADEFLKLKHPEIEVEQQKQEADSTVEQVQCISCGKHGGSFSTDESRTKFARDEVYHSRNESRNRDP